MRRRLFILSFSSGSSETEKRVVRKLVRSRMVRILSEKINGKIESADFNDKN